MVDERDTSADPEDGNPAARAGRRRPRAWLSAYVLFSLAALVAAGIAWRTFRQVRTGPPDFRPACTISETIDCAKAARSDYAVLFRVPMALWAAMAFAIMIGLAMAGMRRGETGTFPRGLLFWLAAGALAASVAMALVSKLALGVVCPECAVIQALSLAVFVVAAALLREVRIGPIGSLAADLRRIKARPRPAFGTAAALAALAGFLIAFYPQHGRGGDRGPPSDIPSVAGLPVGLTDRGNPYVGAEHPAVAVMQFTDYECPHCHEAHRLLRGIAVRHPDRFRLVHFHLPLDHACNPDVKAPLHRQACRLAEAAACAGFQGRFWQMNDEIIRRTEGSGGLEPGAIAAAVGLDMAVFRSCIKEGRGREQVAADIRAAAIFKADGGAVGTPAFVVQDASGMRRAFVGIGGKRGIPRDVLRRLQAGWPAEQEENQPAPRSGQR